jgi:hypothetical protein
MPVPQRLRRGAGWSPNWPARSEVVKLNDQHAFLNLAPAAGDKWQLIPVLDADDRVVDLVRTFF